MVTTMKGRAGERGGRTGAGLSAMAVALALGWFARPAAGQERPTYEVRDFGVAMRPSPLSALVERESVRRELKGTDAEWDRRRVDIDWWRGEMNRKLREARRNAANPQGLRAAEAALVAKYREAIRKAFRPEQWERLDQIQLQAQGPLAFSRAEGGPWAEVEEVGAPLAQRLQLSEDQSRRIRAIVVEGDEEIARAASFPIPRDPAGRPTMEDVRKLVEGPEFRGPREKAGTAGRAARAGVIRRIEAVLTDAQRRDYHRLLGAPFDVLSLNWGDPAEERGSEIEEVARVLGVDEGVGQRADPDFKAGVERPAYAGAEHPRVLFDEAHHNFHTADGRYRPFADLIVRDGYRVIRNRATFTREVLARGDILVIANALGAEAAPDDDVPDPAFTDAECDAVRDWVKEGGSLLLIADLPPWGGAAADLVWRFGVDMRAGLTVDPENSEGGPAQLVFSRGNRLLGDHPITRGRDDSERLEKVVTFAGTSLKGPEGSAPILKLADTAVDRSVHGGQVLSAEGRAQGVALPFGKGRVVVLGEAGELSAQLSGPGGKFGMNVPGIDNRQLALNILHWLSGLLEPREPALKEGRVIRRLPLGP